MPIEKAFSIKATSYEIYAALMRDLDSARLDGGDEFEVLNRDPGRAIELRVSMGGISCWLKYELKPNADGSTEVAAILTPFGIRYTAFRVITLGMRDHAFALALVQGLANLKRELEGDEGDVDGPDPDQIGAS